MQNKNKDEMLSLCTGINLNGSILSRDMLEDNWIAFGVALLFYKEITPEQAFKLISGNTKMKRSCKEITPEILKSIKKTTSSASFSNYKRLSRKFGVSEDVIRKIKEENK